MKIIDLLNKIANGEEVSLIDFLDLVEEKQKEKHDKYSKNVNGYRFTDRDFS